MELRYKFVVLAGMLCIVLLGILYLFFKNKPGAYKKGIKAANTRLLAEEPFFKRKILSYRILKWITALLLAMGILFTSVLIAQPYTVKITKENRYNRDIMICLDVSTSVDELNRKLVKELEDTVRGLAGERVGITIFNTSPVLVAPLTDDYEYIIEQLENIKNGLSVSDGAFFGEDDWLYWNNYLYSGTLVDNEKRGSSLIGDGLLGAAFNFSGNENKRTQIIIFSTDNEKNGEGFVTLPEAAEICRQNGIVVYGIGTKSMYNNNRSQMKTCMEATGGRFYLEENADTFYKIIKEIEAKSAGLIRGRTIISNVPCPQVFFYILLFCIGGSIVCGIVLRQTNIFWIIRQLLTVVLLAAVFITVVYPAGHINSGGSRDADIKSELQILFVIDDTLSMLANDADAQNTKRLDAVKSDCASILEELEGAEFAVIDFHNHASVMAPFTTNSAHIQNVIDSLYPIQTWYAKGSSLNTPRALMLKNVKDAYEKNGQKVAVFFLSDGEITDNSTLESYCELAKYVDGGAVIGYGTKKGGTMTYSFSYSDEKEIIQDFQAFTGQPAVSKIDESNLKSIARDLGISYVPMHDTIALNGVLADLKNDITVKQITDSGNPDDTENEDGTILNDMKMPWGYWLLFPLFCLLLTEGVIFVMVRKYACL